METAGLWKSVGSLALVMTSGPSGSNGGREGMVFEEDRLAQWPPLLQDVVGNTWLSDRLCCIRKKNHVGLHINKQQLYLVYFSSERRYSVELTHFLKRLLFLYINK